MNAKTFKGENMYYNNCQNKEKQCYKIVGEFYVYPSYYTEENNTYNDKISNSFNCNNNFKYCQEKENNCNHNNINKAEDCECKNHYEKRCNCCCFRRWWC